MQRSCLLSVDFNVTLLTEWVAQLKMNLYYQYFKRENIHRLSTLMEKVGGPLSIKMTLQLIKMESQFVPL